MSTPSTDTVGAVAGWPLSRHEHYAGQVATLRAEIQQRVDSRLEQGFSADEALRYAAPLLRAARRGSALRAACLLEAAPSVRPK